MTLVNTRTALFIETSCAIETAVCSLTNYMHYTEGKQFNHKVALIL
jgi:hypothetical protein